MTDLPIWTIAPDWSAGVSEKLEWKTDLLQSGRSGAEQRRQLRVTPRRTFELPLVLYGPERTLFDLSTGVVGNGDWLLPLWHEAHRLTAALPASSVLIPVPDTVQREFAIGPALLWTDCFTYELVAITAIEPDAVAVAATSAPWPAGARLYPLVQAYIPDFTQVSGSRQADRALTVAVPFQVTAANPYPAAVLTDLYAGVPVLLTPPDQREDLSLALDRFMASLDSGVGVPLRVESAGLSVTLLQHRWYVQGRAQHVAIRQLFYALAGKVTALWLPTFFADFDLAADALATDTQLVVRLCGYTRFGGPRVGREVICILLRGNAGVVYALIAGSAQGDAGQEILALSAPLGAAVRASQVKRISFMQMSRQDADLVEIMHYTGTLGVSTVSTVFRSTPENRVALDWTPYAPCGGAGVVATTTMVLFANNNRFLTQPADVLATNQQTGTTQPPMQITDYTFPGFTSITLAWAGAFNGFVLASSVAGAGSAAPVPIDQTAEQDFSFTTYVSTGGPSYGAIISFSAGVYQVGGGSSSVDFVVDGIGRTSLNYGSTSKASPDQTTAQFTSQSGYVVLLTTNLLVTTWILQDGQKNELWRLVVVDTALAVSVDWKCVAVVDGPFTVRFGYSVPSNIAYSGVIAQ